MNLTLLSRDWIPGFEIQASVKNLLDARNLDPVSEEFSLEAVEQNGRTFFLAVSYGF